MEWISGVFVDGAEHPGYTYARNRYFAAEDFPAVIASLQAAQRTGKGAVATARLKTVENEWYGTKGGEQVLLTVVYLSRASEWERQLPAEGRKEVVPTQRGAQDDMSLLREFGPYRNFPHFNTANPSLDKRCVNLLGQLSAWVLSQHADQLREALGGKSVEMN